MTDNTPDTQLEEITETGTPRFPTIRPRRTLPYSSNDTVRTVIYVVTLVASVIGLGFMSFGSPGIGGFISTTAGIIAAGFGSRIQPGTHGRQVVAANKYHRPSPSSNAGRRGGFRVFTLSWAED